MESTYDAEAVAMPNLMAKQNAHKVKQTETHIDDYLGKYRRDGVMHGLI